MDNLKYHQLRTKIMILRTKFSRLALCFFFAALLATIVWVWTGNDSLGLLWWALAGPAVAFKWAAAQLNKLL